MGEPNSAITDYLQKKERFVSFCNYAVGKELFHTQDVEDVDGFYSDNGRWKLSHVQRDLLQKIPRSAAQVLNVCAKMNERMVFRYYRDENEEEEVVDMCKAWEDQYNDGVVQGISQGKQDVICNMLKMGMSDEIIRMATECGQAMIDKLRRELISTSRG